MKIVRSSSRGFPRIFNRIRKRGDFEDAGINKAVAQIISDVVRNGDAAVFRYARKFDEADLDKKTCEVSLKEKRQALKLMSDSEMGLLSAAAERIEAFHRKQVSETWRYSDEPGVELGQIVKPLLRVGIYCPGGLASYPSSILMTAIPAKVAGVREVVVTTPAKNGVIAPIIIAAAHVAGVDRIFKAGGAHAVAALAYGTQSFPMVDKIVGPGNAYVAAAKKMVFGQVGIDMIAGPSEICVIADKSADPAMIAADLLSQAEHDRMASAILLTPDEDMAAQAGQHLKIRLAGLSRKSIAGRSVREFGLIVITRSLSEAAEIANSLAPEHLELMVADPERLLPKIENAGAIFMGRYTPEAIGDYLAGPSHVLPTGGSARFSSPLGVYDFVKRTSLVSFSRSALRSHAARAVSFANLEGLEAHAMSVQARFTKKS
jgi:histidinol dehydrogenase